MKAAVVLAVMWSCVLSGAARAQGGMEATLGLGTGTGTIMCSACTHLGKMNGSTASIQVVQRVNPYLRVGWTLDGWSHARDDWERDIVGLNAVVFYYPSSVQSPGFFIGGGPSYSMLLASVTDSTGLQRHGWGFAAELGYDFVPRKKFSFTPYCQYSHAWVGDIYYPKGSVTPFARGWKHQVVAIGLGVTYHELHTK